MCIRKGYILTIGYKRGAILSADSLDSSAIDENVDAQSRLSYKPSDGCCLVVLPKVDVVSLMWRTHKSILAPSIQTERLDWNLQDLCDSVLLPWPMW